MSETPRARPSLFLERRTYRRRRIMDAARLLPLAGAALLLVPLLWALPDGDGGVPMSRAMAYVFGVWVLLIAMAGLFAVTIRRLFGDDDPGRRDPG